MCLALAYIVYLACVYVYLRYLFQYSVTHNSDNCWLQITTNLEIISVNFYFDLSLASLWEKKN